MKYLFYRPFTVNKYKSYEQNGDHSASFLFRNTRKTIDFSKLKLIKFSDSQKPLNYYTFFNQSFNWGWDNQKKAYLPMMILTRFIKFLLDLLKI
jgi:hypothetical protein